jgi:hypothetical protein
VLGAEARCWEHPTSFSHQHVQQRETNRNQKSTAKCRHKKKGKSTKKKESQIEKKKEQRKIPKRQF